MELAGFACHAGQIWSAALLLLASRDVLFKSRVSLMQVSFGLCLRTGLSGEQEGAAWLGPGRTTGSQSSDEAEAVTGRKPGAVTRPETRRGGLDVWLSDPKLPPSSDRLFKELLGHADGLGSFL